MPDARVDQKCRPTDAISVSCVLCTRTGGGRTALWRSSARPRHSPTPKFRWHTKPTQRQSNLLRQPCKCPSLLSPPRAISHRQPQHPPSPIPAEPVIPPSPIVDSKPPRTAPDVARARFTNLYRPPISYLPDDQPVQSAGRTPFTQFPFPCLRPRQR